MVALTEKLNLMALRFHLGLFIFNPFGVVAKPDMFLKPVRFSLVSTRLF